MVLIAAPDLLPGLKQRAEIIEGKLLTFTDAEAIRALEAITIRHQAMVALERKCAATLGGAALINCINAEPSLTESEVRVVSNDTDYAPVSPWSRRGGRRFVRRLASRPRPRHRQLRPRRLSISEAHVGRRASRWPESLTSSWTATQQRLWTFPRWAAQIETTAVLKPNQRVRIGLTDKTGAIRFNASVAWAKFEIPPGSDPRYRSGIAFLDANAAAVEAYCSRHKE